MGGKKDGKTIVPKKKTGICQIFNRFTKKLKGKTIGKMTVSVFDDRFINQNGKGNEFVKFAIVLPEMLLFGKTIVSFA